LATHIHNTIDKVFNCAVKITCKISGISNNDPIQKRFFFAGAAAASGGKRCRRAWGVQLAYNLLNAVDPDRQRALVERNLGDAVTISARRACLSVGTISASRTLLASWAFSPISAISPVSTISASRALLALRAG
jgi:hypothetical protein